MGTICNPAPESMTTLELVAWLVADGRYQGRTDISRGLLVEAVLDVLNPTDWSVPVADCPSCGSFALGHANNCQAPSVVAQRAADQSVRDRIEATRLAAVKEREDAEALALLEGMTEAETGVPVAYAVPDEWAGISSLHDIRVDGESGWFRFKEIVRKDGKAPWVDCYGGPKGQEMSRSFHLDKVKRKPNGQIVVRTHIDRTD